MNRLSLLVQMNPGFASALARGEEWAVHRAEAVQGIDHPEMVSRRHPEKDGEELGTPQNWCGSCPFQDGCMVCDLPYDRDMKELVGHNTRDDNPNTNRKPRNRNR